MSKNIIFVCDTFFPDKTSGAKLLYDLSNKLSKTNKVLVVVPRNSNFFEIFHKSKINNKKNITILFVPSFQIKNQNYFLRGASEFLMSYILWYKSKKIIKNFNPTSMIVYSPSIFYGYFCKKIKINFNVKSLCILRDLFPYWAIEVGYMKNFFIKKYLVRVLNNFMSIFDNIGLESRENVKIMRKKSSNNFFYLPNWVNLKEFKKNKIKNKKKYNFIFAGNIGGGQDIDKVLKFYTLIPDEILDKFYVVGDGITSYKIKKNKRQKTGKKIIFKSKLSQGNYIKFLEKMDFGIVSINDKIQSVNFPGRLFSYLMANKPVILLTEKNNELSRFVKSNKIGINISNRNLSLNKFMGIKKINKKLIKNDFYIYNFLKRNFSLSKVVNKIEKNL
jgi:glycosyltransferase involved in cell wall biosynthesis